MEASDKSSTMKRTSTTDQWIDLSRMIWWTSPSRLNRMVTLVPTWLSQEPRAKADISSFQELFNVLAPSLGFLISFLAAQLLYFLSVSLIALVARKYFLFENRGKVKTKPLANSWFRSSKAYKLLHLSYVLMTFLVMTLISSNLSTDQVIVDVSDLMYSEETIRNTKRTACYLGENSRLFHLSRPMMLTFRLSFD